MRPSRIEPRAYSNAPVGVNFLIVGYGDKRGGLAPDPTLPLTNVSLTTKSSFLGYVLVLDLWGKSGKIDFVVPYAWLAGSAELSGEPLERVVNGLANLSASSRHQFLRRTRTLLKQFASYQQDWIVGASVQLSVPSGQYDKSRAVNIGTNRWFIRPEVGVSKAAGAWTLELTAAATLFSANNEFLGRIRRQQDPI